MNRPSRLRALVSVLLAMAFLVSLVPSAAARPPRDAGRGPYGFEREARQLARILNVDPWTAADLIEGDKELRLRSGPAIDAQRMRRGLGTGLTVSGAVLTVVGAIITSAVGVAHRECHYDCDSTSYYRGLGTGIGLLVAGTGLTIPGVVLLSTPSRQAGEFLDWYRSRPPNDAAPAAPGEAEPDGTEPAPPSPSDSEPASSLQPVRHILQDRAQGGNTFMVHLLSVPF